ncbi:hypothetical protein ABW19_dt0208041 [Dactylella cylindrospora]|nr:hypothetical protein ABW19_dt0208041 [Dactylella cylindrospora]
MLSMRLQDLSLIKILAACNFAVFALQTPGSSHSGPDEPTDCYAEAIESSSENLATRPDHDNGHQYEPPQAHQQPAQFQGFLGSRAATATSKWAINKPQSGTRISSVPPPPEPFDQRDVPSWKVQHNVPPAAQSLPGVPKRTTETYPDTISTEAPAPTTTTPKPNLSSGQLNKWNTEAVPSPAAASTAAAAASPAVNSAAPPQASRFMSSSTSESLKSDLRNLFQQPYQSAGVSPYFQTQPSQRTFKPSVPPQPSPKPTYTPPVKPAPAPNQSYQRPATSKWGLGVPKKSIFAADAGSVLDQLSGKTAPEEEQQKIQRGGSLSFRAGPPSSGSRRDFFKEESATERTRERSFWEFKTTPEPQSRTKREPAEVSEAELDPVEEAVRQAKKLRKKQRGAVDPEDWDRKSSLRARDKSKHGREWVFGAGDDAEVEVESKAARRERKKLEREQRAREQAEQEQQFPPILIPEFVSVSALARLCKVKLEPFQNKMLDLGFTEKNPDFILNAEIAGLIAMEYGFEPVLDKSHERDLFPLPLPKDKSRLPSRPPVVTIMGHVDHGKTTLLDWLRKSSIVDQEHGGITQHIGAFSVTMPSGRNITFLDTPGHEAFLSMRARGANMTDIVILVVAADDSIMPQTIEAIKHAKSARVPIIVAVNKCDKEDADPQRVKSDLAQYDIQIEEVGGDTQVVCVSGKTGLGMEDLEEAVLLQADDLDMRAEKTGRMEGWVVETTTKTRGRVATILVRRGTLRRGDVIVAGKTWAKVRNLITENGVELEEAPPGTPVEIDGWKDQPNAGDEVLQAESEDKAKSVVDYRLFKAERQQLALDIEAINEQRRIHHEKKEREAKLKELEEQGIEAAEAELPPVEEDGKFKILDVPFIIKADVAGSVEAVAAQILSVANDEVRTKVIKSGVGPLLESDVAMAEGTGAYCLTFNVPEDPDIMAMARHSGVQVIQHSVIYAILDDIKKLMSEKLKPIILRNVIGEAEIAKVFQYNVKKREMRPFAGCRVYRGVVAKGSKAKILRNGETIYDGELETLKNVKKDVAEMTQGTECGMGFAKFYDFKEGDIVHCYTETKKRRTFD